MIQKKDRLLSQTFVIERLHKICYDVSTAEEGGISSSTCEDLEKTGPWVVVCVVGFSVQGLQLPISSFLGLCYPCISFTGGPRTRSIRVGHGQKGTSRGRSLEIQPTAFGSGMIIPSQGLPQLMYTLKHVQGP